MLKIGQVGGAIKSKFIEDIEFSGNINLSDFDVIFIDLQYLDEITSEEFETYEIEGPDDLSSLYQLYLRSISRMEDFYNHGGLVIALLSQEPSMLKFQEFGYDKNIHLFDFLNLDPKAYELEHIEGSAFEYLEDLTYIDVRFSFRYYFTFKAYDGQAILRTKKKKEVVAIKKRIGKGTCYLLPAFSNSYDIDDFAGYQNFNHLIAKIYQTNLVTNDLESSAPDWAAKYKIFDESNLDTAKQTLLGEREILDRQILEIEEKIADYSKLKKLLYAGDAELEIAVRDVFEAMHLSVHVPPGDNDDLHILEDELKAVVEIKGVTKSGTTMHVMQLEKWVTNYALDHEGYLPKGILILNPQRDKQPKDRKGASFPPDMLKFASARGHCLLLSQDLLNIYIDFKMDLVDKRSILDLLSTTIGILKYMPKYQLKDDH